MFARGSAFSVGFNRAPGAISAKRAADRRTRTRPMWRFLFVRRAYSQVRFAPSPAQGEMLIVAASPQGHFSRPLHSDEFGTNSL